jgi:hypothetical protein
LAEPVTLTAGASYYLVSQEVAGGDVFGQYDQVVQTVEVAENIASAYGTPYNTTGVSGNSFGPTNYKFVDESNDPPDPPPDPPVVTEGWGVIPF